MRNKQTIGKSQNQCCIFMMMHWAERVDIRNMKVGCLVSEKHHIDTSDQIFQALSLRFSAGEEPGYEAS